MEKRSLVVKGFCGLGNRLLSIINALAYCQRYERQLIIDWSDGLYGPKGENVFPKLFDCRGAQVDWQNVDTDEVQPNVWKGQLREPVEHLRQMRQAKLHAHSDFTINPRQSSTATTLVYYGFTNQVQTIDPTQSATGIARQHVSYSPDVFVQTDAFAAMHFRSPTIGVHVRLSDHHQQVSVERYLRTVRAIMKRQPAAQVFLATDNQSVQERFQQEFSAVIVTEKWFPAACEPLHKQAYQRDPFQTAFEAVVDMALLTRCDYLVYNTHSTFTDLPALLSRIPATHRIPLVPVNTASRTLLGKYKLLLIHYKRRWLQRALGRSCLRV